MNYRITGLEELLMRASYILYKSFTSLTGKAVAPDNTDGGKNENREILKNSISDVI